MSVDADGIREVQFVAGGGAGGGDDEEDIDAIGPEERLARVTNKLCGLSNIRNTCYMNSVRDTTLGLHRPTAPSTTATTTTTTTTIVTPQQPRLRRENVASVAFATCCAHPAARTATSATP